MEVLVFCLLVLLGNIGLPLFLPWWIIIPFNMLAALPFRLRPAQAFWLGGLASGLVWLVWAYFLSQQNQHLLADKLWQILKLGHPAVLFATEFLLPFSLGGIACMTSIQFKQFRQANG
jgi:hypothetical protein